MWRNRGRFLGKVHNSNVLFGGPNAFDSHEDEHDEKPLQIFNKDGIFYALYPSDDER